MFGPPVYALSPCGTAIFAHNLCVYPDDSQSQRRTKFFVEKVMQGANIHSSCWTTCSALNFCSLALWDRDFLHTTCASIPTTIKRNGRLVKTLDPKRIKSVKLFFCIAAICSWKIISSFDRDFASFSNLKQHRHFFISHLVLPRFHKQ